MVTTPWSSWTVAIGIRGQRPAATTSAGAVRGQPAASRREITSATPEVEGIEGRRGLEPDPGPRALGGQVAELGDAEQAEPALLPGPGGARQREPAVELSTRRTAQNGAQHQLRLPVGVQPEGREADHLGAYDRDQCQVGGFSARAAQG